MFHQLDKQCDRGREGNLPDLAPSLNADNSWSGSSKQEPGTPTQFLTLVAGVPTLIHSPAFSQDALTSDDYIRCVSARTQSNTEYPLMQRGDTPSSSLTCCVTIATPNANGQEDNLCETNL